MYNFKGFAEEVIEKAKKFKRPQYMKPIMEESNKNEHNYDDNDHDSYNKDNNVLNTNESQEQHEDQETISIQNEE